MSIQMEDDIKRWTAKRKTALILDMMHGKTSVAEASRANSLSTHGVVEPCLAETDEIHLRNIGWRKRKVRKEGSLHIGVEALGRSRQFCGRWRLCVGPGEEIGGNVGAAVGWSQGARPDRQPHERTSQLLDGVPLIKEVDNRAH